MPARCWCGVWLAVTDPTDHAVEPPKLAFFSNNTTLAPRSAASMAEASPAPPPPTTTTSRCRVESESGWGCVMRWIVQPDFVPHLSHAFTGGSFGGDSV